MEVLASDKNQFYNLHIHQPRVTAAIAPYSNKFLCETLIFAEWLEF